MSTKPIGYQQIEYNLNKTPGGSPLRQQDCRNGEGFVKWSETSDPDKSKGTKKVFTAKVYVAKSRWDSAIISSACLIVPYFIINEVCRHFLPFMPQHVIITMACFSYAPLAIAYHASRVGIVSLYIIGHALYDMIRGKGVKKTLKSHTYALGKQVGVSLWAIVKSPFHALKFNIGHIYTLLSARNGMVFASNAELEWNRKNPVHKGYSLLGLFGVTEKHANFEGGGQIENLRPDSFYLLRCYQPIAEARMIEDHSDPNNVTRTYEVWSEGGTLKGDITKLKKDSVSYIPDVIRLFFRSNHSKVATTVASGA